MIKHDPNIHLTADLLVKPFQSIERTIRQYHKHKKSESDRVLRTYKHFLIRTYATLRSTSLLMSSGKDDLYETHILQAVISICRPTLLDYITQQYIIAKETFDRIEPKDTVYALIGDQLKYMISKNKVTEARLNKLIAEYPEYFEDPVDYINPISSMKPVSEFPGAIKMSNYIKGHTSDSQALYALEVYDVFSKQEHYGGLTIAVSKSPSDFIHQYILAALFYILNHARTTIDFLNIKLEIKENEIIKNCLIDILNAIKELRDSPYSKR